MSLSDVPLHMIPLNELFHNKVLFRKLRARPTQLHSVTNRISLDERFLLQRKLKHALKQINYEQGFLLKVQNVDCLHRTYPVSFYIWKRYSPEIGCLITAVELCRLNPSMPADLWIKLVGAEGSGICYNYADRVICYSYVTRGSSVERSYVVHFRIRNHIVTE